MKEISINNNITENDYLELGKDCMNRIAEKNKEIDTLKKKIIKKKIKAIEIFGCFKKLEKFIGALTQIDSNIDFLIREIDCDLYELINEDLEIPHSSFPFSVNITFDNTDSEEEEEEIN